MIVDRRIVPAAFTDMQEVRVNFAFLLIHELSPTPSWSQVQPRCVADRIKIGLAESLHSIDSPQAW